jgi:hypothetical protein
MAPQLPPPDPAESHGMSPDVETTLEAPVAVFLNGAPDAEADRITDAILDLRPGALFVFATS